MKRFIIAAIVLVALGMAGLKIRLVEDNAAWRIYKLTTVARNGAPQLISRRTN